ncbi:MAG: prepilin peptidase, partial [Candidatus Diapherotrites archaeon]|nr:prepilin peptidase [Candidatus Diapherotrites archaeon]
MPVNFLLLRTLIAAAGSLIGAYTDFKTGYIYDKITYPMIALGAILTLLSFNMSLIWMAFSTAAFIYAVGWVLEYLGQFGGGDVKLLVALALLLPLEGRFGLPIVFFIFILASLLQVVWVPLYYGSKYLLTVKQKSVPLKKLILNFVLLIFVVFYLGFLNSIQVISIGGAFL